MCSKRLVRQSNSESGTTVLETAIAAALSLAVLLLVGMGMFVGMHTASSSQAHSEGVDKARNALDQVERDLRNATALASCTPAGSCLQVTSINPSGGASHVKYWVDPADSKALWRGSNCTS